MNSGHYTLPHIRKLTFQGLQYVKQKRKWDSNTHHSVKYCLQHAVQVLANIFWVSPSQTHFVPAEHTFSMTVSRCINTVDNELENLQSKTIKSHCILINIIFKYNKGRFHRTLKSIYGHCTHLVLLFPNGPHLKN